MKVGILIAAAGTRDSQGKKALSHLAERARKRHSGIDTRWAYTATGVRKRLAAEGTDIPAPADALAGMVDEGFSRVAVWSLHVIPGREFHALVTSAAKLTARDTRLTVAVSRPLLSSYTDLERTATAVLDTLPGERDIDEAIILIGHGNAGHPADMAYAAAGHVFATMAPRVFVATVSGRPNLGDVMKQCQTAGVRRAHLHPFTTVAGSTVQDVVSGDDKQSWTRRFAESGIEAVPMLRGLAEVKGVADIWLDHLDETVRDLVS